MISTGLSFTYQGAAPYAYPPGKAAWFHWGTTLVSFSFASGTYAAPAPTSVVFSFKDGIHPSGFVATVWGGHTVHVDSLRIFPAGFATESFGLPAIRNAQQKAYPPGFVGQTFGLTLAYNLRRYVYPSGAQSGSFGTQLVQHNDIRPNGIKLITRWGTANVYNKTVKIYPTGRAWDTFGTGMRVENHKFTIDGLVHTQWGLPLVKNWRAFVLPASVRDTKWGTSWISNKRRNIYPTHPYTWQLLPNGTYGYAFERIEKFGLPRVSHKRIAPAGLLATKWGTAWLAGTQYVRPFGILDKLMGNKATVTSTIRNITPHWSDLGQFGAPSMSPLYIRPAGFDASTIWMAIPRVGGTKVTSVTLGVRSLFGTPYVSYSPLFVLPPSLGVLTRWGVPPWGVMHTFVQFIRPPLLEATKWGREDWDYRVGMYVFGIERDVMNGFIDEQFGKPSAVDGDRYRWENTRLSKLEFNA